jgi:hypothetical protein
MASRMEAVLFFRMGLFRVGGAPRIRMGRRRSGACRCCGPSTSLGPGSASTVAQRFNRRLRALAWKLNLELPGARVAYVEQYRLMATMIDKPREYAQ